MRKPLVLATLVLFALAGCESPSSVGDRSLIHVAAVGGAVEVSNVSGRAAHYIVLERQDAGIIEWTRCTPANTGCPTLQEGQTARVPYAQIAGYDEGDTEAIVYWWETEPDGAGGYRVDRQGSVIVRLQ